MTPEKLQSKEPEPNLDTIADILEGAKATCDAIPRESGVVEEGITYGDEIADIQTAADQIMGDFAEAKIKSSFPNTPAIIFIEGRKEIRIGSETPRLSWNVDQLDASLDREKMKNTFGFPYSFSISVFKGHKHTYADYLTAGVIDLRSGDTWISQKGKGLFVNGEPARTSGHTKVDLGKNIGIAEQYYTFNRVLFALMFEDQKGWLRSPGSAALEMASVANGSTDFFISAFQKPDVLGTAFAHLNEAGGFACDMFGNSLGEREYDFTKPIEQGVIQAASKPLAVELVERFHHARDRLAQINNALESSGLETIKLDFPKE